MAMVHTKSCPNCKNVYYRETYKRIDYGSPFVKCAICGTEFFDGSRIEPATKPYKPIGYLYSYITNTFIVLFLSIIPFGIVINGNMHIAIRIICAIIISALVFFLIGGCKKHTDTKNIILEQRWIESKERMSDPEYVELLRKMRCGGIEPTQSEENTKQNHASIFEWRK